MWAGWNEEVMGYLVGGLLFASWPCFFYEYLWFWADSWTLEDAYIAVARRLCPDARQGLCFMHGG